MTLFNESGEWETGACQIGTRGPWNGTPKPVEWDTEVRRVADQIHDTPHGI